MSTLSASELCHAEHHPAGGRYPTQSRAFEAKTQGPRRRAPGGILGSRPLQRAATRPTPPFSLRYRHVESVLEPEPPDGLSAVGKRSAGGIEPRSVAAR